MPHSDHGATGSALASHDHVSWHADIGRHSSLAVASGGHEMNRCRLEQRTSPIIAILIHLVAFLLTLGVSAKRLRSSSEARIPNRPALQGRIQKLPIVDVWRASSPFQGGYFLMANGSVLNHYLGFQNTL